jgi:hypothetical protein
VKDCSLHVVTANATHQRLEIHATTCQRSEIHAATCVTCQSPKIHATTCQRPEIHAATCVTCQSPEIHATTCQRPEIHAATCQRPEIYPTCQRPEVHATCQRPETHASSQLRRNKRSRRFRGHLQALSYPPTGPLDTVGVNRWRHEPQGGQPHPSAPRTTHLWPSGLKGEGERGRGRDLTSCGHMALVATKWRYPAGTVW